MRDHTHYVPILRWKAAEKRALRELGIEARTRITPLIEWSRVADVSPEEDRAIPVPTPREVGQDILRYWGARAFFYDPRQFWNDVLDRDTQALRRYAAELASGGTRPIAVLRPSDRGDYRRALASLTGAYGVCVRLGLSDLTSDDGPRNLEALLDSTGLSPSAVDLVVDFEARYQVMNIRDVCGRFPSIRQFRTFTVAAGAFPVDLRAYKGPQIVYLSRGEWVQWYHQVSEHLPRRPDFGDYATLNPVLTPAKKGLRPSASIRYATDDYWVVMKGEALSNPDGPGYDQYPASARLLMERPEFCGADFSAGDQYIYDVAMTGAGPGNPTTWVQAGVNHHMVFVVNQLQMFEATARRAESSTSGD